MAYSYVRLPGNGTNTNFGFSFGYLSKDHISVKVDGVNTAFNWLSDFVVLVIPAPANGTVVEVRRTTPKDEPIVDWADGATITESDMDLNSLFALYCAQEAQDSADSSIQQNSLGQYDAHGRRIINVADPVNDQDAATKHWSLTTAQSFVGETAALLADFKGTYFGALAANPSVDPNGNPVTLGDLYFNTTINEMRVYSALGWKPAGSTIDAVISIPPGGVPIAATAGQTRVPIVGGYDSPFLSVFVNGSKISPPEIDISSGIYVDFAAPLSAGDEVDYIGYGAFDSADAAKLQILLDGAVDAREYGAKGDNSTDNAVALQAFFNGFVDGGVYVIPKGTFRFSQPLVVPNRNNIKLRGAGGTQTTLLYTGTNTNTDIIRFGDGVTQLTGADIGGFKVDSTTNMVGGAAFRVRNMKAGSHFEDINGSTLNTASKLWDGIWFDNINVSDYSRGRWAVKNQAFIVNGKTGTDEGSDMRIDRLTVVGAEDAYVVGGGFGGIYYGQCLAFANGRSFVIDNSRATQRNREVFFDMAVVPDGCRDVGIHVNDPLAGGSVIYIGAEGIASAGLTPTAGRYTAPGAQARGINILIEKWAGRINIGGGELYNATGSSVKFMDPATEWKIATDRIIAYNGGYGIETTFTSNYVDFDGLMHDNALGNVSPLANVNTWQTLTFTPSPGLGAFGAGVAGFHKFKRRGNTVYGTTTITIPNNGTASDSIYTAIPYGPKDFAVMNGVMFGPVNGTAVVGFNNTSGLNLFRIVRADGTYPGGSGANITLSWQFEAAQT